MTRTGYAHPGETWDYNRTASVSPQVPSIGWQPPLAAETVAAARRAVAARSADAAEFRRFADMLGIGAA